MEIKDLKANQGNIDLVAEVVEKEEPRAFEKFGKSGRVCNAKLKDATGVVKLTLWNNDIELVSIGDKVHLQNGWCSEFKGDKQLSTGKFGKIEVVEKASGVGKADDGSEKTVFTNDPNVLMGGIPGGDSEDEDDEDTERIVDEEEFVD